jgi:signal transduction histidine kinase
MSPDEAAHAFERFWQAEPTVAHPRPGSGLGLAIVAELVAAHGGTINLDTSLGTGTTFTITLPSANDQTGPEFRSPSSDVLDPLAEPAVSDQN